MPTPAEQRALSSLGDLFRAGRVAMQLGIGSGFWNYSNLTAFRWGVAAVPRARDNKVGAYVDPWMIAAKSANPEGAWALLKYITGDEGQRAYVASIGTPPVTRGAHQEWLKRFEPALKATDIAKVTEGADRHSQLVASHTFIRLAEMTPILNPEIEAVNENRSTPGDAVRRAKPPLDQKIAEIAQAVQAKYGRK
jgi:multiple sugar transport system substrate-binding protein